MRLFGTRPTRIAIVASVIARYDAISIAVRDTVRVFRQADGFDVDVFAARSDFPDLRAHIVQDAGSLAGRCAFRAADLAIYHFGVFSPLFDRIAPGDGHARQIVYFHGVTPPELAAPSVRPLLEQSLRQLTSFRGVDRFWATSTTTADALAAQGVDREIIEVIPLAVERPPPAALAGKSLAPIRLLFVGRLAQAKGVLDLIEAVDIARRRTAVPFQLDIAGNEEYSDASYADELRAAVMDRCLSGWVRFLGAVNDAALDALYGAAHLLTIPSYHEGFCRPAIEGLRAGCVPVGYAAYNLPRIADGLGRMVPAGDRGALAAALVELIEALASPADRVLPLDRGPLSPAAFDSAAQRHARTFAFEGVAAQWVDSARRLLAR